MPPPLLCPNFISLRLWREIAVPVGGRHAAIHQEVAASYEAAVGAHEKRTDIAHFVRRACASCRGELDHAAVAGAARPRELILGERRDDDAGADGVDARAALSPAHGFCHD